MDTATALHPIPLNHADTIMAPSGNEVMVPCPSNYPHRPPLTLRLSNMLVLRGNFNIFVGELCRVVVGGRWGKTCLRRLKYPGETRIIKTLYEQPSPVRVKTIFPPPTPTGCLKHVHETGAGATGRWYEMPFIHPTPIPVQQVAKRMVRALTVEGIIISLFVIANGVYVVVFPPVNDEPQGYAIIAIGIFILLVTIHLDCLAGDEVCPLS